MSRRGVSLLEVLVSVGVAFIGLLGAAALMPLAAHHMNRGTVAEQAAVVGNNAIADFTSRNMDRPDSFAIYNANLNAFVPFLPNPSQTNVIQFNGNGTAAEGASFCIDPLLISTTPPGPTFPVFFPNQPINNAAETRMARVTLRILPGRSPLLNPFVLPATIADQIFRGGDDLLFNRPDDRTLAPVQEMGTTGEKRQTEGELTWMATMTPIVDNASGGNVRQDLYTLSIVVFERRVLDTAEERVMVVNNFYGGGVGGGDVELINSDDEMRIRPGEWIMLSARYPNTNASVFRWYRVVSATREGLNWHVFLDGADWNNLLPTQATHVPGVIAVFEKTVRLKSYEFWTN